MSHEPVNPILPQFLPHLDPQFIEIYNKYQAPRLRADQVSIGEYRANTTKYTFPITPGPKPEVGDATIHRIPVEHPAGEIRVKVYTPTEAAIEAGGLKNAQGLLPAHVNYHGGGWVIGSLLSDEPWCRSATQTLGLIVVDVDYRLAPEHPHPAQVWDSWAALKWVFANASSLNIDPSRVSIGGLSAGGHIAAVLALLARDEPGMPILRLQLLVVPAVDARSIPLEGPVADGVEYGSMRSCEFAPCLPLNRMRWFSRHWLGMDVEERKKKQDEWICSPILAPSHAGLAPASIRCAEFDVLRDEGVAYNDLLNKSGTPSRIKIYKGVCHPFAHWHALDKAREFDQDTFDDLRQAHALTK